MLNVFALSLGLTLLLELPIAYFWGLRKRQLLTVFAANLMTNPLAVALHLTGIPQLPIEIGVVIAEGFAYSKHFEKRPWLLAIISNALSWGIGILIQSIL